MEPADVQLLEADLSSGEAIGPVSPINTEAPINDGSYEVPEGAAIAYRTGAMSPEDKAMLEADIDAGRAKMNMTEKQMPKDMSLLEKGVDMISGGARVNPMTEAAKTWEDMPEFSDFASWNTFKTALGTMFTGGEEEAKVIAANAGIDLADPSQAHKDAQGNWFFKSPKNGEWFAQKPGLRMTDAPGIVGAGAIGLATAPASAGGALANIGRIAATEAMTQAGIEGTQAATGGDFNKLDIAIAGITAGLMGGAFIGGENLAGKVAGGMDSMVTPQGAKTTMTDAMISRVDDSIPVQANVVDDVPVPQGASMEDIGLKAKQTGRGSKKATEAFADMASPDPAKVKAAKELGVEDNVQTDHQTTSQAYREIIQALKSQPGSILREEEMKGLQAVGKRAISLIEEFGGTTDLSSMDLAVRTKLDDTIGMIKVKENKVFTELREEIPKTLAYLEERIDEVEGFENLAPVEKELYGKLSRETDDVPSGSIYRDDEYEGLADGHLRVFHTSPNKIESIEDREMFGDSLFFSDSEYSMGDVKHTYVIDIDEDKIIEAQTIPFKYDLSKGKPHTIIDDFAKKHDMDFDEAEDLIVNQGSHDDPDISWESQGALGKIAKSLGYDAAQTVDEQGGVYIVPMKGKIDDLLELFDEKSAPEPPKYSLIDDQRKMLGVKSKKSSMFGDPETDKANYLYGLLAEDQMVIADGLGLKKKRTLANSYTKIRKKIEGDRAFIYGKALDASGDEILKSIIQPLLTGMKSLQKGDTSKLINLIKKTPRKQRKMVVASGLAEAFGKAIKNGDLNFKNYRHWFKGIKDNSQSFNALGANLRTGAMKDLENLYLVSDGIDKATAEYITTGRLAEARKYMEQTDTFMRKAWETSKTAGKTALVAEAIGSFSGVPFVGGSTGLAYGIGSAIQEGGKDILGEAQKVINSQSYINLVKELSEDKAAPLLVEEMAKSGPFRRFAKAAGLPQERKALESWITSAMARQSTKEENK